MNRTFTIQAPDGREIDIEAADEASAIQGAQQWAAANPKPTEHSEVLGFQKGAMHPIQNAARGLEYGLENVIGLPEGTITNETADRFDGYVGRKADQGVLPGKVGEFTGNVVGTAPLTLLPGGPLVQGAAAGAALTNAKDPLGVAIDATVGAAGNKGADIALRGLAPRLAPEVKRLFDEGLSLTPGQVFGGAARGVEDALTSVPLLGDIIKGGQRRSLIDLNRAATNRALTAIGEKLPKNIKPGHEAVEYATTRLGQEYDNLLPSLTAKADLPFIQQVQGRLSRVAEVLTPERTKQLRSIVENRVLGRFDRQTGVMAGETMKQVESELGNLVREYSKSTDADQRMLADGIKIVQDELRGLIARRNPAAADRLKALNEGWANLKIVQDAAGSSSSVGGVFNATRLNQAVTSKGGKAASSQKKARMQDLSDAAKDVLPAKVPDSGSAKRLLTGAAGAALGFGGIGAAINPVAAAGTLAGAMLGSAAYSRFGQQALRTAMTAGQKYRAPVRAAIEHLRIPGFGAAAATVPERVNAEPNRTK